jgi:8-oxo-dGTP pyrophosphatase MutT (NUDIX family)
MPLSPQHSVSVAAIIVNDHAQVLMTQRRDNGHWEPPGGVLELDESILDGLRREVREETGLDVEPERLTGVYKNMPRGIVALVFRARVIGGTPADRTDETARMQWLSAEDIPGHCDEAYAVRVLDAINDTGPAIRAHDGVNLRHDLAALPN